MQLSIRDLTFIVPVFNMQETAERAVESIIANNQQVRVIVVDDASSPPFVLPESWNSPDNIQVLRHDRNRGAAAARNTGIHSANTDWLAFLDADDVLLADALDSRLAFISQKVAELGNSNELLSRAVFSCGWVESSFDQKKRKIRIPREANTAESFASGCWYCPGSTLIAHRNVYADDGAMFEEGLRRLEDFDWGIRFGLRGGVLFVDSAAGVAIEPSNRMGYEDVRTAARQIANMHKGLKIDQPTIWNRLNAYLELEKSSAAWRAGNLGAAAISYVRSLLHRPRLFRHFSPGWAYRRERAT